MRKFKTLFYCCVSIFMIAAQLCFTSIPKEKQGVLQINFKHTINNDLLKLDSVQYKNELGQTYSISKFKYYIGNIHLKNKNGQDFTHKGYFLINEDDELSKQIILNTIPPGNYSSISFVLGVDSLNNCSGAQSGALDPVNAMFWAWNTGYIFLKLEGNTAFSRSPGGIFEYHIGGYKQPSNCIRKIELDLSKDPLKINSTSSVLEIKADAAELLKTPTTIDFSVLSSVTDASNAELIANNYKDLFSILSVKNEN